jgi:hypothetical protein
MGFPLTVGYAVAATDTGHQGTEDDASFALGHPEKLIDYGYRAVHEMALKAKTIIAAYYGGEPEILLLDWLLLWGWPGTHGGAAIPR